MNMKYVIESGKILLTLELSVKRLRRFDLPSADLDHAMIRVGDSGQMITHPDHCVIKICRRQVETSQSFHPESKVSKI